MKPAAKSLELLGGVMLDFRRSIFKSKSGFGLVEVMVSIVVLGFMYVALNKLQVGNHDAFIRIRGRDGAIEVAQQVLDSLKSVGAASIASAADPAASNTIPLGTVERKWERGLGGYATVIYTPTVTVSPTEDYIASANSNYETVRHVYAKQVNVKVEWSFKGSTQSINVSGVVR